MQKRLFIVSNRLPLSIERNNGELAVRYSSGGLVSAINAYMDKADANTFSEKIWAGVAECSESDWNVARKEQKSIDYTYLPVYVEDAVYEDYYNGFSNSLLWPLFHYFPSFAAYNPSSFDAYLDVNQSVANALCAKIRDNDVVWIHDYHLLPLAGLLRKKFPNLTIGLFLHIPFPSYELFRVIPTAWQKELLSGMLGADLVGFHTVDYAQHFLSCLKMVYKIEHEEQFVQWKNRQVKIEAFPISIDFKLFNESFNDPAVVAAREKYIALKGDMKLIFSVDRLDYTKGLLNRLIGFRNFLVENPEYNGRVIFVLVVVPSRDSIDKYAERKKSIDEYISNLNSTLGNISWQPVIYHYNHLPFEELIALYTACEIALITPLRDGMNLVSKEFIASRQDKQGVLILSEMAGAARELTEALLINPNDSAEIAAMIKYGLEMDEEEQHNRISDMQERVRKYDVSAWAEDFFTQLNAVKDIQLQFEVKLLDSFTRQNLLERYSGAKKRLLLLDYDGTLVPFSKEPALAKPTKILLDALQAIASHPLNEVFIVSGRDSNTLEKWLGDLPVGLIAEHGAKIRPKGQHWLPGETNMSYDWIGEVEKVMSKYLIKCPHSFIEKKEFSVAWHYRNAELIQGNIRSRELLKELNNMAIRSDAEVLDGNKVIEVRNVGVNKGIATDKIVKASNADFILCVGDDATDEDMFKPLALNPAAVSIKVGYEASFAKYNLYTPNLVLSLLQNIVAYPENIS